MRKFLKAFILVAMGLALSSLDAHAEKIDMGELTCNEVNSFDEEEMAYLMFWLDGYASHQAKNNVIDADEIAKTTEKLIEHCKSNPKDKVLDLM